MGIHCVCVSVCVNWHTFSVWKARKKNNKRRNRLCITLTRYALEYRFECEMVHRSEYGKVFEKIKSYVCVLAGDEYKYSNASSTESWKPNCFQSGEKQRKWKEREFLVIYKTRYLILIWNYYRYLWLLCVGNPIKIKKTAVLREIENSSFVYVMVGRSDPFVNSFFSAAKQQAEESNEMLITHLNPP